MSFEIQELPDIIRIVVLLNLTKGRSHLKTSLKSYIDKVCTGYVCVEMSDLERTLEEMVSEGLIEAHESDVKLTEQGAKLGRDWQSLLLKKEPILEIVAGLVDGSITGLVVILSAAMAGLTHRAAAFAAFLTLAAVSITNFSSFLLGGITEDQADMITLRNLMHYSLSDIADHEERNKSLELVGHLFALLHKEINRANIVAAVICGATTFLAGIIPLSAYLLLPKPIDVILSLGIVATVVGVFLVRYRSQRSKVHWKITLLQTAVIIVIAVVASLVLGGIA